MTGATLTDVSASLQAVTGTYRLMENYSTKSQDFSSIMTETGNGKVQESFSDYHSGVKNTQVDASKRKDAITTKKSQTNGTETEKTEQVNPETDLDETINAVNCAVEEMKEAIATELDVSVEEVEAVMEMLGMQGVDLLNADNMADLVVNIKGVQDVLAIVTDADLYENLTSLIQKTEDLLSGLKEELGMQKMPTEDFTAFLQETVNEEDHIVIQTEETNQTETMDETQVNTSTAEAADEVVTNKEIVRTEETKEQNQPTKEVGKSDSLPEGEQKISDSPARKDESKKDDSNFERNRSSEGNSNLTGMTDVIREKLDAVLQRVSQTYEAVTTESIMEQVTEYVKVNVSGDIREMEFQLHPENLGNLHLQVALKEGNIVAQFTAQNEAVKAAIEAQVVQLKETLQEQGLKVESVEVTVNNHQFEEHLPQDGRQNESQTDSKKGNGRRIRLTGIDVLDSSEIALMDEEEQINAQMMVENGNTVDFTA